MRYCYRFLIIIGLLFLFSSFPVFASQENSIRLAANPDLKGDIIKQINAGTGSQGADLGRPYDPRVIIAEIIRGALTLIGTIFVVLMFWGGYLFVTAHGEQDQVDEGTKLIRGAIIGLIIVLMAYSITTFVGKRLPAAVTEGETTSR